MIRDSESAAHLPSWPTIIHAVEYYHNSCLSCWIHHHNTHVRYSILIILDTYDMNAVYMGSRWGHPHRSVQHGSAGWKQAQYDC